MNNVNECCHECNTQKIDQTKDNCPVCNKGGISVSKVTVEHLVTDDYHKSVEGEQYKICMNEYCNVVYYSVDNEKKFLKDQVRVPIWFKKDANPKYACYCSKVTEDQVIDAVLKHGAKSVKEVNAITGAMKNSNCKEKNPLGTCCHKIIQEAIDKGLKME
ncbi:MULTISPECIES: Csac_0668 family 2Fe-2S cluster-binding (seleno)protein [Bacillota]|jgi:bacterioferritin-associated ferredoxin|uniref:BFD-like [2Fe-2S] binding domain n=2 Tax=Bacillota TaxID=1239 RepID=A0A1W2AJX8_9FIRM|nr:MULTISPECIES: (2Fe-2S)-binding protein [Bacillota]HAA9080169.1 (2Fe-2S)-binding protein [Listeria monocytogenes]OLS01605.1 BFD-like [2Fe-2S] binding domain protein [Tissierella creatinophila DSM 6911]SMC61049.1 BFD-like [2Fe-2S] binding domain [Papillibacter cinnamivorans DSM 12816]HAA9080669.1 (2Fe-2S)-binding protein [Listeria monocytogenes]HBM3641108.1 (2Fe-2S)-binding protein [Listeria innocua]